MILDRFARMTAFERIDSGSMQARMYGLPPAGVPIDADSALRQGTVWACCKLISEALMRLPWHVYERVGDARELRDDDPADRLLHRRPNPESAAYAVRSAWMYHLLLRGNCYAEIERNRRGDPLALWPIHPDRVTPERDSQNTLFYKVRNEQGRDSEVPADDMFHVLGPTLDGVTGLSVIAFAKHSISAGVAVEDYGATFFGNGAVPGGLIQHAAESKLKSLTESNALKNFYESWEKRLKGPGKGSKVMYLDPGLEYKKISIDPDDAQFIETQKATVPRICQWFLVPPHKVQSLDRATFNNIEQQDHDYANDCLMPWAERLEQEAEIKLVGDGRYTKMSTQALLRGDMQARAEFYTALQRMGDLTINQVLGFEDMDGIGPDGDVRLVPAELTTLERMIKGEVNAVGD